MGYIYCITNIINNKDTLVKPSLLYRKDFRNTARILEKKDVKNVHYMML